VKAGAAVRRRDRVPRDAYRATARAVGIRPRLQKRPVLFDAAILAIAGAFVIFTAPMAGGSIGEGIRQFTASVTEQLGNPLGTAQIELPSGAANVVGAEPRVDGLPDFTREPELSISGRVPSFALAPGRTIEIVLNAAVVANAELDDTGTFAATLTLRSGANAIGLTLLSAKDVVARSAYTVTLDREPPALQVLAPVDKATVDGPNVIVQGKTEVGAAVTVNGRTIVPGQDGSFSESFTPAVGPVAITVVARDRAGNETTAKSNVTLRAPTAAATVVTVTLDRARVRPGEIVVAQIRVTERGLARPGTPVTLSVGLITIGSFVTDSLGNARFGFAAPPNEGEAPVLVFAAGASGRATLTVAR
jgi:glucodextranase-like protein